MLRFISSANRRFLYAQQQWAPLRTSHDPNPPITLEDAVVTDTGPIGTGVNCLEFANYDEIFSIDENAIFFISEDFIPPIVSVVFLRPSRIYYAT